MSNFEINSNVKILSCLKHMKIEGKLQSQLQRVLVRFHPDVL